MSRLLPFDFYVTGYILILTFYSAQFHFCALDLSSRIGLEFPRLYLPFPPFSLPIPNCLRILSFSVDCFRFSRTTRWTIPPRFFNFYSPYRFMPPITPIKSVFLLFFIRFCFTFLSLSVRRVFDSFPDVYSFKIIWL